MNVLIIDVGGTSVKLWHSSHDDHKQFPSGKDFTPAQLVEHVKGTTDWTWEVIALGLPCPTRNAQCEMDPENLGPGWKEFNFSSAFHCPVRILNDAALQALGSYEGGRMLFLGLGTALGSALVAERLILTLDICRLRYDNCYLFEILGKEGYEQLGQEKWEAIVHEILPTLKSVMLVDYIVIGGGNSEKLRQLPPGVRLGGNRAVAEGGRRLWEELPDPADAAHSWIVV